MPESLDQEIIKLQDLHGSSRDPNGRAFVPLADAYRRAGELEKALDLLQEGLNRHPEYTSAHVVSSWVHLDRGAVEEALGSLELVLGLDRDNRAGLRGLGQALNEKGDRDGAIEHLTRLAELEPEDAEVRTLIETIQAAEPVVTPDVETSTGTVAEEIEDASEVEAPLVAESVEPVEAVSDFAVEAPEVPEVGDEIVTRTMGDVYASQGLFDQAVEVYEALASATPEDRELAARLEELRAAAAPPIVDEPPIVDAPPIVDQPPTEPDIVPIHELEPEPEALMVQEPPPVSIDALAPDDLTRPAEADRPVVPIESLAPVGERPVVPIALLAPDDFSADA